MNTEDKWQRWYNEWIKRYGKDCPHCFGSGQALGKHSEYGDVCPVCKGKGTLK